MNRAIGTCAALAVASGLVAGGCKRDDRASEATPPPAPAAAQPVKPREVGAKTVQLTLRFPEPHTHYAEVEAIYPTAGADSIELMMAVWTPGSYLVREYERNVESVSAATPAGEPLAIEKTRKNRWRIETDGSESVVLRYRVYGRELTVRTNYIDSELAIINGAPTFIVPVNHAAWKYDLEIELPEVYEKITTALPRSQGANRFLAPDYDTLADSPIVLGKPVAKSFRVNGTEHVLATFSGGDVWDYERSAKDVESIATAEVALWGDTPYPRYVYLNVVAGGGGGLEHKASTLMQANRWMTRKREDYVRWLGLVSHEFFHTWNVKRLRPVELGPFDYENEVHTRMLWVVEGFTSYYDDVMLCRAGLITEREYLDLLGKQISGLQTTPGRKVQPLALSSYDAWIKYYRGDENSVNSSISYYTKGAIVGFLLDAEIRAITRGKKSLDDVMKLAYERFADKGYTPEQFEALAAEVAGTPLDDFFARSVHSTEELEYERALGYYGLAFEKTDTPHGGDEDADDDDKPGYLGIEAPGGQVSTVKRGTPAHDAGVNVGDEIIAIGGYRVHDLAARLEHYRPGDEVELMVSRHGKLVTLPVTLGEAPKDTWKLVDASSKSGVHAGRRTEWLGECKEPAPDE